MAQDRVEAVERALTVLEAFDSDQQAFSLAELAQATGFYKSTLLRLLGSLARFDYVRRDKAGLWHLGESPRRLARRQDPHRLLATRVQPLLDDLAARLDETASLLEQTREGIECRLVALPAATLRHDLRPGMAWSPATDDTPCPALAGGRMVAHPLPTTPGAPLRWLAVSGPEGRLVAADATLALAEASARLEAQRRDTPIPEVTP
ncbi:helix-turn-helix domain-containing protein [Halomonas ramblicola]|uniref:helix-turn-helix domain-containing protein n=1 Tax=Halomonas ramblicola TaxID=747349 RepID=UPI0025B35680|nr:helix-turn-helix domain-containing protein [Halomonas ramblicola]MDN3522320.1 helix-turn-helix domain-containing protein [Halomonas ramblicola]